MRSLVRMLCVVGLLVPGIVLADDAPSISATLPKDRTLTEAGISLIHQFALECETEIGTLQHRVHFTKLELWEACLRGKADTYPETKGSLFKLPPDI